MIGIERPLNPAHSGCSRRDRIRAGKRPRLRQAVRLREEQQLAARALGGLCAEIHVVMTIELEQPISRAEQSPDLVELVSRMVGRARDDDLELLTGEELALRPAPHAADGLSTVELERDDHREPQRRRHDGAGRYPIRIALTAEGAAVDVELEKGIEPLSCSPQGHSGRLAANGGEH